VEVNKINVLITGVGAGGVGYQILTALRSSAIEYNIVTADTSVDSKGLKSGNNFYLLPAASSPLYIDAVEKICRKHKIQALFYGSEPELKKVSDNRELFEKMGVFLPLNPKSLIDQCLDKNLTAELLKENGFDVPKWVSVKSEEDLAAIDFFPVVLKPSIGGGGSANLMLAQNKNELISFGRYLLQNYSEFIIQEYIGDADSEYTVGILCDMNGNLINSIAMKRIISYSFGNKIKALNRTVRKELGETLVISSGISQGWIGKYPHVTKKCEEIALKLGCTGAINIQCRYFQDKIYVFEINPRFSGTTSMRALAGYNEPDVLIRKHLLNESIEPSFAYREGLMLRGLEASFIDTSEVEQALEIK
jgi:carbamoyl-phosphate synthase large subunit